MTVVALPSLRRKILRAFSVMIFLYGILGAFLVAGVLISTGTTPRMIHRNYDSIAASEQMREAWSAIKNPKSYAFRATKDWRAQFEQALRAEEMNITEPGENEITDSLRNFWNAQLKNLDLPNDAVFAEVDQKLGMLININEKGMFGIAQSNAELSHYVLVGSLIYFLISLVLSIVLADGLANRLSQPIKSIAEALHRRPSAGRRLKLVEPNSLELLILTNEIKAVWERVIETDKVNIREIILQKSQLETVLESVEDGLLVVQTDGRISHCNECMQNLIGLPLASILGAQWRDLPTANANYMQLRALLREDMPNGQELELAFNEKKPHFSARYRKMLDAGKNEIAVLYLLHDITEKRHREKFRAEFIDLLSHELKTPLQSLGTASELLVGKRNDLPEHLQPLVETIAEDVDRIRAVANEFVQVTQSHSKILKLKLEMVPLNQLLPDWLKPFRVVAKDRNVKINFEQSGSLVVIANLDQVKFPWVISNILSNAVRFSPPGGEVDVILTDRNGAVEIQIKDQGPGISEEDQRRMFEPFFQSAPNVMVTPSGARGLFGIGLTIAKEVVEAHDGRIEYYPRSPQGSEFRVILPFPPMEEGHV